jgi:hypothetical protein
MSNHIIIAYIFTLFFACVGGIITFDRLVQLQKRDHPQDWERDGKPWHGFSDSGAAWKQCSITWLFSTAPWMREDRAAFRLLMIYRCLGLLFNLGLMGGILYRVL